MSDRPNKRQKTATNDGPRITDPRFANIQSDPRYRLPGRKQKPKLDKRFARSFKNEDFVRRAKVDRYGRPIQSNGEARRLMEKFDLDGESESDEPDDDEEVQKELARVSRSRDVLREGRDVSSSEETGSSDEDDTSGDSSDGENEAEEAVEDMTVAQSQAEVPTGEVSSRIAVVNLDWDNIRAEDLMAVFSSFVPTGGRLLKVSVYPSEFGKERMEREEMEGPPAEIFATAHKDGSDSDASSSDESESNHSGTQLDDEEIKASMIKPDDGRDFDSAALRTYQLERLRYFYAALTFSSPSAAKAVYDLVDGTEYLSTANFFDLRFIPDSMDFSDDTARDECEKLPAGYRPNEFVTDALQHSKVKLTWDAEDKGRKEVAARAFKGGQAEMDENDLKAYLGSDTSDDESDVDMPDTNEEQSTPANTALSKKDAERAKMRAALGLLSTDTAKSKKPTKDAAPTGNIQITFSSGLSNVKGDGKKRSVFENSPEPHETTVERYVRKEKERKARRKEKMKAGTSDSTTAAETRNTEEEINIDEIDSDDAVDETASANAATGFDDPFFNDTEAANAQLKQKSRKEERLQRRKEREAEEQVSAKQRAELELLMASDDEDTARAAGLTAKQDKGKTVRHFDMTAIEKAEKLTTKSKKGKKLFGKSRERNIDTTQLQDDFELQTADPRLSKLFESHEFAIDPTRGGVRQTKATKEILDEARRRKQGGNRLEEEVKERRESGREKKMRRENGEVRDLVDKIKRRAG